jgi:choline dehydrogenase-like flavoprotein
MSERVEVVVVGSGAGGGVVAGELARRGRQVLLLETGPYKTSADFSRWEAKASHDLSWPIRFAGVTGGRAAPVALVAGRCVGGGTTINTKVALRAHSRDLAKWHPATGITGESGAAFGPADLAPYYDRVEQTLGVRERTDWPKSVHTVEPGFRALGAELEPVTSYTDYNCSRCGSCIQGCPSNAGKSTLNTYIQPAYVRGELDLRAGATVRRVLIGDRGDGPEATGVEYEDADGDVQTVDAGVVVVAAGTLNTPQLLQRSGLRQVSGGSPSSALIGRNLGLHPARMAYGLFDEPQDAHMVYPITTHSMAHQHDEDGGFVVEATTIMEPIGFATNLADGDGPLWGAPLVDAVRRFRHWVGLLVMANDDNNGLVEALPDGGEHIEVDFQPHELSRMDEALRFSEEVLRAAGATRTLTTTPFTTHVQGTCRMGDDPARSVVDRDGESHDVKRLFVGDGSLIPRTLSVNPSLTIMALAARLAEHLDADSDGYLQARPAAAAAGA